MTNMLTMDRRGLMQRAMLLLGASAVAGCDMLPGLGASADLSSERRTLLDAFADTLIPATTTPGALAAGVPAVLAKMYHDWASDETREQLSGALDRIDEAARRTKDKSFTQLTAEERKSFLASHDGGALIPVPPPANAPKGNPFAPEVSVVDNGYAKLKELVAVLYYASEAALTSELEYEHVPGGWTASVKVTPDTKPAITFGAF